MEIDITRFVNEAEPFDFSASIAERGERAGPETWANAVREGADAPLLTTPDQIEALREYTKGYGAWDDEHIAAWTDAECNAMFIQLISGDLRELEVLCMGDDGAIDWDKAEELAQRGAIGGSLFNGIDGRIYYYLGT